MYVNDDRTSNLEKIKEITFEGTSQEEYFKTLINLRKLESTLQMSSEEEKLSMDHFKRKLIPSSPFSRDLKSILINHLFGNKETEVTTIKQFIRMFIEKMKEVQEIAEKARAIGWTVGLSTPTPTQAGNQPKNPNGAYPKKMRRRPPSLPSFAAGSLLMLL